MSTPRVPVRRYHCGCAGHVFPQVNERSHTAAADTDLMQVWADTRGWVLTDCGLHALPLVAALCGCVVANGWPMFDRIHGTLSMRFVQHMCGMLAPAHASKPFVTGFRPMAKKQSAPGMPEVHSQLGQVPHVPILIVCVVGHVAGSHTPVW